METKRQLDQEKKGSPILLIGAIGCLIGMALVWMLIDSYYQEKSKAEIEVIREEIRVNVEKEGAVYKQLEIDYAELKESKEQVSYISLEGDTISQQELQEKVRAMIAEATENMDQAMFDKFTFKKSIIDSMKKVCERKYIQPK